MTISLEAISFNHDPVSTTMDAFTIRKNQSEDVTVPEWTRVTTLPQNSSAAYSIGQISANNLTIKAQFSRQAADPTWVEVRAIGRSGNVLGNVRSRTIRFGNGLSAFELLELDSPSVNPGVGRWDISWDWFVDGTFAQTTQHRIYTLLDAPKDPWGQVGSTFPGFQVPWTEVLEHACVAATGARHIDEAAALLTRWVFSLGGSKLKYNDQGSGSSCFTIQGMDAFNCTNFLEALNNGHGTRQTVNCIDCATILSCFGNILGCELTQSRIGFEFKTNLIQKIGSAILTAQQFKFHEVAWKFPSTGSPTVFDSCLQIDGDANPTDDNFSPILGINFPMGSPTGTAYHGRLIKPTVRGKAAKEFPRTRRQRKIDNGGVLRALPAEPTQLRILEEEYEFSDWSEPPRPLKQNCAQQHETNVVALEKSSTSEQSLFLKNYSLAKGQKTPAGWKPGEAKSYRAEPDPVRVTDVVWSSEDCSGAALRVLTYECTSIASARSFVLALLAEFQVPGIQRRREFIVDDKPVKIGDVAFSGSDEVVLLFARANNVTFIQNVGRTPVSVSQFAREMDEDMTSDPELEKGQMIEMQHFKLSYKRVSVGDEILIQASPEFVRKEKETLFKFFAPAGQVFVRGDELLYRCLNAGEQSITILASKAEGETARQVLTVFAEPAANLQESPCRELENPIKEERVMPDVAKIIGVWSSIRPTTDGEVSADMRVDGYIEIKHRDPDTGRVTGFYRDEEARSTTELLTGQVVLVNSHFYMNLHHPMGEGVIRFYEGEFVHDDGDVQLVAGKYYDRFESNDTGDVTVAAAATDSLAPLDSGQENGTWVATKP